MQARSALTCIGSHVAITIEHANVLFIRDHVISRHTHALTYSCQKLETDASDRNYIN